MLQPPDKRPLIVVLKLVAPEPLLPKLTRLAVGSADGVEPDPLQLPKLTRLEVVSPATEEEGGRRRGTGRDGPRVAKEKGVKEAAFSSCDRVSDVVLGARRRPEDEDEDVAGVRLLPALRLMYPPKLVLVTLGDLEAVLLGEEEETQPPRPPFLAPPKAKTELPVVGAALTLRGEMLLTTKSFLVMRPLFR